MFAFILHSGPFVTQESTIVVLELEVVSFSILVCHDELKKDRRFNSH